LSIGSLANDGVGAQAASRNTFLLFFCLPKSKEIKEKGTLRNAWQAPSPPHMPAHPHCAGIPPPNAGTQPTSKYYILGRTKYTSKKQKNENHLASTYRKIVTHIDTICDRWFLSQLLGQAD
jgi:hypothetical protein